MTGRPLDRSGRLPGEARLPQEFAGKHLRCPEGTGTEQNQEAGSGASRLEENCIPSTARTTAGAVASVNFPTCRHPQPLVSA